MRRAPAALAAIVLATTVCAQDVPVEYQVKAAYLYNFVKFVEWPPDAAAGPLTICVAGRNVFGPALEETVRGESVNGRPLQSRVILQPEEGCHVVFVPRGAAGPAYLAAARGTPTLTVGEEEGFIGLGGIISFHAEGSTIRFTINPGAARRAGLQISSRLLQLARIANDRGVIE